MRQVDVILPNGKEITFYDVIFRVDVKGDTIDIYKDSTLIAVFKFSNVIGVTGKE